MSMRFKAFTDKEEDRLTCAYYEAMDIANDVLDRVCKKKKLNKAVIAEAKRYSWNIKEVRESKKRDALGRALLDPNCHTSTLDYVADIEISDLVLRKNKTRVLRSVMVHEIFHVMAEQLSLKPQHHKGLWLELAKEHNRVYKGDMQVREEVDITEVYTKEELKKHMKKVEKRNQELPYKYELYCPNCERVYAVYKIRTDDVKSKHLPTCKHCKTKMEIRAI